MVATQGGTFAMLPLPMNAGMGLISHMACPTGRCGSDVRSIFGDIVDDLGVASDILVGGEADIIQGHTQLLVDLTANN